MGRARGTWLTPKRGDIPAKSWRIHPPGRSGGLSAAGVTGTRPVPSHPSGPPITHSHLTSLDNNGDVPNALGILQHLF